MFENSTIKDPSYNLDDDLMSTPAADISHVEQGKAKQSQPSVRDNVLAFCIVFCQLVQVSQLFLILSLVNSPHLQSLAKRSGRPYHTAQDS